MIFHTKWPSDWITRDADAQAALIRVMRENGVSFSRVYQHLKEAASGQETPSFQKFLETVTADSPPPTKTRRH